MKNLFLKLLGRRYRNVEWAKRNKKLIGFLMIVLSGFVYMKCPGLESYCAPISLALSHLGTFLSGAGILDSDLREKYVQGLLKPKENKDAIDG